MTGPDRAAYIAGLRKLADTLERDESIPLPRTGRGADHDALQFGLMHHVSSGEEFAAIVRAIGGTGWRQETKSGGGSEWIDVTGHIGALLVQVSASTYKVCEPIPPQPVIERKCPALDALIAEGGE